MEEKDRIEKGLNDLYIYWKKKLDYQSNSSSELPSKLYYSKYYSKYYSSLLFSKFISFFKLNKKN